MTLARRSVLAALAALLAVGCVRSPVSPTAKPRGTASARPLLPGEATPSPEPSAPGGGQSPLPSPLPGASPLAPPTTNTLIGMVKAPAALLGNNAAGLVSDHGTSYRLTATAPEQFFVPGAKVEVLDAAGNAVKGPDGQPLVTTSAADGSYRFTAPLPSRNVVVRATPPGGAGSLSRLVANGLRAADLDLPSSLVASYVLDQYVSRQGDPQTTLDKLPADVEAKTVSLAAAALVGGVSPVSLDVSALVTSATALRRSDAAFDGQMEVVKKILIAAGVSNLGTGLAATDVYMRRLFETDVAPDGTLYATSSDDYVIWRVSPDGILTPAVGTGFAPTADEPVSRAGRKASEIRFDIAWALAVDDLGRPVVSEYKHGVWRLEPDGTITELFSEAALAAAFGSSYLARGIVVRSDGTLVTLVDDAIWSLTKAGAKTKLVDAPGMRASMGLAELAGGQAWRGRFFAQVQEVSVGGTVHDVVADADPRLAVSVNGVRNDASMDGYGNVFYVGAADSQLHRLAVDGTDSALLPRASLRYGLAWARQGHDGKVYVSDCDMGDNLGAAIVRRIEGAGTSAVVAGVDGLPKGFTSDGRFPLLYPKGLDVAPDGTLWVADSGALLELAPGGKPRVIGEKGTFLPAIAQKVDFTGVRRLASGKLVARALGTNQELILRQGDAGAWEVVMAQTENWGNPWNVAMHAWDAKPDGTVVASIHVPVDTIDQTSVSVMRRAPGELLATALVPTSAGFVEIAKLTYAPDGTLWMRARKAGGQKPGRYRVADDGTVTEAPANALADEARDGSGRLYEGDAPTFTLGNYGDRHIRRHASGGTAELVAGPGTTLLGGTTLDDSIGWAEDLRFDAAGNLYVRDVLRRQVRRIPKERF